MELRDSGTPRAPGLELQETLDSLPRRPGVYRFTDAAGS